MTPPASAPRYSQPGRLPGGLHYSWVIVGILVVVQVIGSAISQSAGIMVAPLRDPICIKLRYLTCSHGFKPRARPPYRAHIHQAVGDSCGVSFFAYTATWGALA